MRASVRTAGILIGVAATAWLLVGLAGTAAADLVTPNSADQPVSTSLQDSPPKAAPSPGGEETAEDGSTEAPVVAEGPAPAEEAEGAAAAPEAAAAVEPTPLAPPPVYTPVPETTIKRAVPVQASSEATEARAEESSALERAAQNVEQRLGEVGAFFAQVVRACQVGVGQSTGGPVAAFAVLSVATVLIRRRTLWARLATDEEAPEFLYAWDVIAPG